MKTFLYIRKRILNEKYLYINFEFYLSRRTKNVHMGLNCGIFSLHGHDKIIADIGEICLLKDRIQNLNLFGFSLYILLNENLIILFLEKILIFEISIEFKRYSSRAHAPKIIEEKCA